MVIKHSKKTKMSFSLKKRAKSFSYAITGIGILLKTQHNAWIHVLATVGVVVSGFFFGVSRVEWALLIVAMVMVWLAEALNTSVEFLADFVCKEQHPLIGKAKDVAAGGVLIAAIGAAIIGILVFAPYLSK
jgi:diacylglycerol kinase